MHRKTIVCATLAAALFAVSHFAEEFVPGREVSIPRHLQDGEELEIGTLGLIEHGRDLFLAPWTVQEGGGRPLTKGVGRPLSDPGSPLAFPRNFNRVSGPDANSCAGCHDQPRAGGGGDFTSNVFVLGQRFDSVSFDGDDTMPTRGAVDERGDLATLDDVGNSRATPGMFGSGYIEMLARQMTLELRAAAHALAPGESRDLVTKGVSFGRVSRLPDGAWDTSGISGLPPSSVESAGPSQPPSLIVKPFHQAGAAVSLREFTNNAFNHHHGMQTTERFGVDADPDGDGVANELTRADVTAVTVFQATLPVPGRVIPRYRPLEEAVLAGEEKFVAVGCAGCHVPELPLDRWGWEYYEPNLFNPPGNLRPGDAPALKVNLNGRHLPPPRLRERDGVTLVPAFTDLKLHDITSGPDDPNCEALDMHAPAGSDGFFAGNCRFLTKKLWGSANEAPFFHHGKFTTFRESILAHAGEAQAATDAFLALSEHDQGCIIEFLKTLQVLPESPYGRRFARDDDD